jgi:hypothetical protein
VSRFVRSSLMVSIAFVLGVAMILPASAAARAHIDSADRVGGGRQVNVTATISCDPFAGEGFATFAMNLFQGNAERHSGVQGFGGVGIEQVDPLMCDGLAHTYTFPVVPFGFYADRKFRPGPAGSEWIVQVCIEATPGNLECTIASQGEQRIKIRP